MIKGSKEVRWSTVLNYDDRSEIISSTFNVLSDGTLPSANTQNYFYIFVPYYSRLRPDIVTPSGTNVDEGLGNSFINVKKEEWYNIGIYEYYSDSDEVGSYRKQEYYGVIIYKIEIRENNYPSSREQTLTVTLLYGEAEDTIGSLPISGAEIKPYTIQFTVVQDGKEDIPDPSIGTHIYYETLTTFDEALGAIEEPLVDYGYYINTYPLKLQATYHSSGGNNINDFNFIHVATYNKKDAEFIVSSNVSWAKLYKEIENSNGRLFIYEIIVDENEDNSPRNAILEIKLHGQTAIRIDIVLYGVGDNPEETELPNDIERVEDKYWEGAGTNTPVSIIDTNQGAAIDSTSLLFKSNFSNYYSTIELKDGTLFLGNYTSNKEINNVHNEMNEFISLPLQKNVEGKKYARKIYIDTSASLDYSYIPNMKLDSQLKRIFKPGETYALGLVFVDTTGTWSSVYYLGDTLGKWEVDANSEPYLKLDSNGYYYEKPVKGIRLSKTVTNRLSYLGIIAVIPVYAVKTSNTIMCLGFLSPSLQSTSRQSEESILSQYSWFYRNMPSLLLLPAGVANIDVNTIEILNLHANRLGEEPNNWIVNRLICSLNTPEVECDELLSEAMLLNAKCKSIWNYTNFIYNNNIIVQVSGKYIHSYFSTAHAGTSNGVGIPIASIKDRRYISGYLWRGFVNNHYPKDDILSYTSTNTDEYYSWYAVYPWQRSTIGGEGPTSSITNKVLFNSLYNDGTSKSSTLTIPNEGDVDAAIYRNFDTASIIKVGSSIYQGNVDYISVTEADNAYKAMTSDGKIPKAHEDDGVYAGYDKDGNITDPISIKYKTAPHIVLNFLGGNVTFNNNVPALFCVELYNPNITLKTETLDLQGYLWIKCGDIKRILPDKSTVVLYEEGDYFFGRYDSLRTYRYAENDVNSVVEVVSGMLCSKVNLDSRCDRNRGVTTPTISPTNFNIFNPVYNQLNNYFTFSYVNLDDLIYKRLYSNSIQWSLTKEYSSDIDNWCNILDINTLDFDGDKGQIRSIERLGNELIVFQDTAISLIQYNEKTQIATEQGIPIEIGNSGKVDGKHYLYDHVGCLYKGSISKSPNGIYFVDSINKSLYQLGVNAKLTDLCTTIGMKSWGIANIDSSWWSYYDTNSQEVIFSNNVESLTFSDAYGKFNSFVGYGGIRWNFRGNDLTIQICPVNFKQVISTTTPTLSSNKRIPYNTKELHNDSVTFWKKNSIDETKFFGNYSPIEILLQCNPEPTIDKIFSTVEYRMDCFDELNNYLENVTFDSFRAWNEYQDTALINLNYLEGNEDGPIYNRIYSTKLRKKFRIWRLDIPRASYKSISLLEGNNAVVSNEYLTYNPNTGISIKTKNQPRDRIRNPWCNIYLSMDTSKANGKIKKIIFNDLAVQYFK